MPTTPPPRPHPMLCLAIALAAAGTLAGAAQRPSFMPIDEVRPGMEGVGRTVFIGDTIEEFKVHILGVLHNVLGPRRDLILARLEGGQLATTGVIAGMSGSPVYVDGRLVGAVSYALGSFPREPYAGITPIGEMLADVDTVAPRAPRAALATLVNNGRTGQAATPANALLALQRLVEQASPPVTTTIGALPGVGAGYIRPLQEAAATLELRPIGAAMVVSGFDPEVDAELRRTLGGVPPAPGATRPRAQAAPAPALRPGDAVGLSLVRGDLEVGATGTVTLVDGNRVYAFGHPFLNLGPTLFPMTRAYIYGVLPSLQSSIKIAGLGPGIGTMTQDRASAVGGTLGAPPQELDITLTLASDRAGDRRFSFHVIEDPLLTPLFAYVAVLNTIISWERQTGAASIAISGTLSFGRDGQVAIDDVFTGDTAATGAANAVMTPLAAAAANEFRALTPATLDLRARVSERQESTTIERVWLDTTKPKLGATCTLQVLLRDFRGGTQVVTLPITMPTQAQGPLTLLVADAPTLTALEAKELRPGAPTNVGELLAELNRARRNDRVYVRLLSSSPGTVVNGETLPALPGSVRSILDNDRSASVATVSRAVVGAWEQQVASVVHGSREITIVLSAGR